MRNLCCALLVSVILFAAGSAFAQAPPHAVVCMPIVYSDGTTQVLEVDMHFIAYISIRPGEILTEDSPNQFVFDGGLQLEVSTFPTVWSAGEILMLEITGDGSNFTQSETESFEITLTSDNPQYAQGNGPGGEFILPVELSSFSAEPGAGQVTLTWVTTTETENAGFNVLRATEVGGEYAKINEALIPGAGSSTEEHTYVYSDEDLTDGLYFYQLEAVSTSGITELVGGPIEVRPTPTVFALNPAFPNPMAQTAEIAFQLPSEANISLRIYNMAGREVQTLESGKLEAGYYTRSWNGTDSNGRMVRNGVYFCRMDAGSFSSTNKLVVLR